MKFSVVLKVTVDAMIKYKYLLDIPEFMTKRNKIKRLRLNFFVVINLINAEKLKRFIGSNGKKISK